MEGKHIKEGTTYYFVATDSPARKKLEGQPFTVVRIDYVWRRIRKKGSSRVKRYFDADGNGARADELEPLDKKHGWLIETDGTISEAPVPPVNSGITTEEPPPDDLPF